jgi:hypothetical protein
MNIALSASVHHEHALLFWPGQLVQLGAWVGLVSLGAGWTSVTPRMRTGAAALVLDCWSCQQLVGHRLCALACLSSTHPLPKQADLTDPASIPATLVGISAIIDCATARPEESTQKVDWEGKVALIQCAQVGWWVGLVPACASS